MFEQKYFETQAATLYEWKPKEEFELDKSLWVDAEDFLKNGRVLQLLYKRINQLTNKNNQLKKEHEKEIQEFNILCKALEERWGVNPLNLRGYLDKTTLDGLQEKKHDEGNLKAHCEWIPR